MESPRNGMLDRLGRWSWRVSGTVCSLLLIVTPIQYDGFFTQTRWLLPVLLLGAVLFGLLAFALDTRARSHYAGICLRFGKIVGISALVVFVATVVAVLWLGGSRLLVYHLGHMADLNKPMASLSGSPPKTTEASSPPVVSKGHKERARSRATITQNGRNNIAQIGNGNTATINDILYFPVRFQDGPTYTIQQSDNQHTIEHTFNGVVHDYLPEPTRTFPKPFTLIIEAGETPEVIITPTGGARIHGADGNLIVPATGWMQIQATEDGMNWDARGYSPPGGVIEIK